MDIDRDRALGIKEGPTGDAAYYEIFPNDQSTRLRKLECSRFNLTCFILARGLSSLHPKATFVASNRDAMQFDHQRSPLSYVIYV